MYKYILIRFGELSLKGKNKMKFINILAKNIKKICNIKNSSEINIQIDRIFIPFSEDNLENLNYVFGISSFSPVIKINTNLDEIKKSILLYLPNNIKTFKINSRRHWKDFEYDSLLLNKNLGSLVLNNTNLSVNIKNPDSEINIEIHKEFTYLFFKKIQGLGGLPVGSSGSIIHLISGGIDSPVAAYKMMKRGVKVDFLSFISPPHTDQKTVDKINQIVSVLNKYQKNTKLFFFNYTDLMNYISLTSNQSYKIILMRRSFYRIATNLAKKNNNLGISNGENLGQVASQTMEAMNVIHNASKLSIYQPLLTNDKLEIIELAKKIKTFNISIIKACETCELFAPKKPSTKPKLETALILEKELDGLNTLENKSIDNNIKISFFD